MKFGISVFTEVCRPPMTCERLAMRWYTGATTFSDALDEAWTTLARVAISVDTCRKTNIVEPKQALIELKLEP